MKPPEAFQRNAGEARGFRASCRDCEAQRRRERAQKARADVKAAVDEFDIDWELPIPVADLESTKAPVPMEETRRTVSLDGHFASDVSPLPPPVQRSWEPASELDMSGPGLPRKGCKRVLAIPDLHFPFHSHRGVRLLLERLASERFDVVIQLGDFYDLLSASRYPRSVNLFTPKDETDEARRWGVWLWAEIRRRQPRARCVQLRGNHCARVERRVLEVLPAIEHLAEPTLRQLFTFEGVELVWDDRQEVEIDGVLYHHGHRSFGAHVMWNMQPTVNGHLHRGGIIYRQTTRGLIWEANAGWLGDFKAPCFGYVPQRRVHGTSLGWVEVDELGPRFVSAD